MIIPLNETVLKFICIFLLLFMKGCTMVCNSNNSNPDVIQDRVEGYIHVPGGKVWYKVTGVSHDYLESLSDERPAIFYDQLGCGNSEKPDEYLSVVRNFFRKAEK